MSGNDDGKCSGVTVKVFAMATMNPYCGMKPASRNVSTPTLMSVMEMIKSV